MKNMKGLMLVLLCTSLFNVTDVRAQEAPKSVKVIPWKPIAMKDIIWRRREVKEIDAYIQGNAAFRPVNGPGLDLFNQLIFGALMGKITAYSAENDRFTTDITGEQLATYIRNSGVKSISHYLIKEDSLYVAAYKQPIIRILGIAPMGFVKDEKGNSVEKPLFWIYYPDCREYLAQGNAQTNWDAIFEGRQFACTTVKSNDRIYGSPAHH